MAQYEDAGRKHTAGDMEVNLEFVNSNQRLVNGHCSMWCKIFLVGKNWKQEENYSLTVCPLKLMYKDHKGWTGLIGGPAPTRPIASANSGLWQMNGREV